MKNHIKTFFPSLTIFLTSLTLLFATAAQAQVPSYVPTDGLVGWWPFNGNANDESGNGNNLTGYNSNFAFDRFGNESKAFFLNGQDAYAERLNATNLQTNSITISSWINTSVLQSGGLNSGDAQTIVGYLPQNWNIGPAYKQWLFTNDNSILVSRLWTPQNPNQDILTESDFIDVNAWYNVTTTYDESSQTHTLFVDGQLVGVISAQLEYSNQIGFYVGATRESPDGSLTDFFNGKIDDIGIWNRALTADEVLALYNGCNITPQVVTGNTTPSAFANSIYTCNNNAGSTYAWAVNNGVIVSGQGTNSVTILWGAEGVGSVTVAETTADGCVGDEVIYDVDVQCVVSGNEITGPAGPEAFSNSTYTCNGAANSTYNWTVTNGVISSGQGTNTVNILWASTGLGNVSVVETTAEGCVGTTLSQDVVVIPTNVEELSNAMILYPNPVTTSLTLQVKSEMIGSDFVVFDALGKVVLRDKILSSSQNISVISLSNGNYILRVGAMNKVFTISK